jgi:hypothetical protein
LVKKRLNQLRVVAQTINDRRLVDFRAPYTVFFMMT